MKAIPCKESTGKPFFDELAVLMNKHNVAMCAESKDEKVFAQILFQFYRGTDIEEFYTSRSHCMGGDMEDFSKGRNVAATVMTKA